MIFDMDNNSIWMEDPALEKIDRAKLVFLEKLFLQTTNIKNDKKEMMSFLLSLAKLSKENNISFKKDEVELIYSVLQKYSSDEDIAKMKQLSSYFRFL